MIIKVTIKCFYIPIKMGEGWTLSSATKDPEQAKWYSEKLSNVNMYLPHATICA